MEALPFKASFDALTVIAKELRLASSIPGLEGIPALCFCYSSTLYDRNKRVIEEIPYSHFGLAFYREDPDETFTEVRVLGWRLFIPDWSMEELVGKRLVVKKDKRMPDRRDILVAAKF